MQKMQENPKGGNDSTNKNYEKNTLPRRFWRIQDLNATRSVNILIIKFSFLFQFCIISE